MKYAELSDDAKEKAREWYAEGNQQDEWWDNTYYDAVICLGFLGFDATETETYYARVKVKGEQPEQRTRIVPAINFSGFYSQGDGACFRADWAASRVDMAGLVGHVQDETLTRLCAQLSVIALQYPDMTASVKTHNNHYSHSGTMTAEIETNVYDDAGEMIYEAGLDTQLQDIARAAADWIYRQLEAENDYMNSEEYIVEAIEANEYEFDEDGDIE